MSESLKVIWIKITIIVNEIFVYLFNPSCGGDQNSSNKQYIVLFFFLVKEFRIDY